MTNTTPKVAYSLQDKWELEKAYLKIDELQKKNLRLAERNNALIKDSIKAQEILTRGWGMRFTEGAMFFISMVTFLMGVLIGVLVMAA